MCLICVQYTYSGEVLDVAMVFEGKGQAYASKCVAI